MDDNFARADDKSPVVERFLRYKRVIQGRSKKTVDEYGLDLRTFFRYLISAREGSIPEEEEFEKISIACADDEFVRSITTLEILEFMAFCANERGNNAAKKQRAGISHKNLGRMKVIEQETEAPACGCRGKNAHTEGLQNRRDDHEKNTRKHRD